MTDALKTIGAILIVVGLAAGAIVVGTANWKEYNSAKEISATLFSNQVAKAHYEAQRSILTVQVISGVAAAAAGALSGILFLALGDGLAVLVQIRDQLKRPQAADGQPTIRGIPPHISQ